MNANNYLYRLKNVYTKIGNTNCGGLVYNRNGLTSRLYSSTTSKREESNDDGTLLVVDTTTNKKKGGGGYITTIRHVLQKYNFDPHTLPVTNYYINYDTYQQNQLQQLNQSIGVAKNKTDHFNIINDRLIGENKIRMFLEKNDIDTIVSDNQQLKSGEQEEQEEEETTKQLIDRILQQISSSTTTTSLPFSSSSLSSSSTRSPFLTWSQQILPNTIECKGESVKEIATNAFNVLYPLLFLLQQHHINNNNDNNNNNTTPFKFIFSSIVAVDTLSSRCELVRDKIMEKLKETRKQLYHSMVTTDSPLYKDLTKFNNNNIGERQDNLYICQILMTSKQTLQVCISKVGQDSDLGWTLPLPFELGVAPLPESKIPPSRAYIKLLEALILTGRIPGPGDKCAELGSSPGGWTALLLSLNKPDNISLESVDRSPLDTNLTKKYKPPVLTHSIGNGAVWLPKSPVSWLFNDMSIPPEKSLEVLDNWIAGGHVTDTFLWTLKFVGSHADPTTYKKAIDKTHQIMSKHNSKFNVERVILLTPIKRYLSTTKIDNEFITQYIKVESDGKTLTTDPRAVSQTTSSIGFAGYPGSGKSTLFNAMVNCLYGVEKSYFVARDGIKTVTLGMYTMSDKARSVLGLRPITKQVFVTVPEPIEDDDVQVALGEQIVREVSNILPGMVITPFALPRYSLKELHKMKTKERPLSFHPDFVNIVKTGIIDKITPRIETEALASKAESIQKLLEAYNRSLHTNIAKSKSVTYLTMNFADFYNNTSNIVQVDLTKSTFYVKEKSELWVLDSKFPTVVTIPQEELISIYRDQFDSKHTDLVAKLAIAGQLDKSKKAFQECVQSVNDRAKSKLTVYIGGLEFGDTHVPGKEYFIDRQNADLVKFQKAVQLSPDYTPFYKHYDAEVPLIKKKWEDQEKRAQWKAPVQTHGDRKCEGGHSLVDHVSCSSCQGYLYWVDGLSSTAMCRNCGRKQSLATPKLVCRGCGKPAICIALLQPAFNP
ncbi:hypothetical protein DFA_08983 [Cavenderia fasciculata]|uniref:Ribosomal RNA methyltransferase FtsJ domain-containing protein n=1 Tax=Cavenderia fasciculata TaxID=261658 RepID=F4Q6D5_CACFS|nr:uncharacterized protein DFA_08983 [Cavenderia fasciculata]EGG16445.1 hypothetical protein DFA_08983 [Cavenderia fasciculata]|eukprot:XP_004354845.1 hypothetical protein DFA_08983 [Cavenderia fasciculata]